MDAMSKSKCRQVGVRDVDGHRGEEVPHKNLNKRFIIIISRIVIDIIFKRTTKKSARLWEAAR